MFGTKKGCLAGKNEKEKADFFRSLHGFALSDEQFFKEQFADLLPHEQKEFTDWLHNDNENLKVIKTMLNVIGRLLEEKKKRK